MNRHLWSSSTHRTARRAALVATIWVPLAIVVVAEVVVIGVGVTGSPRLITNWGADPDRSGPWWTYAILVAVIGLPVIAIMGFFMARATRVAGTNAWMPAIAMGVTVFHAVGMGVGSVVLNASPLAPTLPLAGGALLAVATAMLTWRFLPHETPADETVPAADALPIRTGEVAAWTGRVELPAWFMTIIATAAGALIVLGVSLLLAIGPRLWPVLLAPTLLLAVLLVTAQFVATAGPHGFVVRSAIGWPRLRIPATDLANAGVITVDPMADFGGWGFRWVIGPTHKGRWGVLTHRGPGLEVFRHDGRSIVIAVDDPGTAAAVLETCATKHG
ncbi:conserved membrane hypothetical protein [Nostocoides japonicum T1-X7]|uniref:DUF1648 domain-containing protein n=1 Tax=Nostocoides japonicum T1-X7 TaxID=1194083 RepID=A0A077M2H7_9MICO|nr:hypothetical protein [Tetrasphaera japonica]CCH78440.1 conserved membrane hypothetical protein [Tetrasphaera japonica T1-X7]